MSLATYIMLGSGLFLFAAWTLFRVEAGGGRLLLPAARERADRFMEDSAVAFLGVKRVFGASSLRLFLHYVLHQFLSVILYLVRLVEDRLHALRAKNKVAAKDIRTAAADNHLSHIARHKEAVALSEEEREHLKHRSLHQE